MKKPEPLVHNQILNDPESFMSHEYLSINKYRMSPIDSFKHSSPGRTIGILNPLQDTCILIIERSTGCNADVISGDVGRDVLVKCIESGWGVRFIVPGTSFSLYNSDAEPDTPAEIKFYFYDTIIPYYFYNDLNVSESDSKKIMEQTINEIHNAFRTVYTFDSISIEPELIQNILDKKPSFFKIKLVDQKTTVIGYIDLDRVMIESLEKEEEKEVTEKEEETS